MDATIITKGIDQEILNQLIIEDLQLGQDDKVVTIGDNVTIHYEGKLEDGTIFDSSMIRGVPFQARIGVGELIKGWDIGILGLKVGGRRKLVIPYQLAYGPNGIPGMIPPKSTLIFEVELLAIN
jgi:FKBP-type peptidyl-prolyl cis-trans isomerase